MITQPTYFYTQNCKNKLFSTSLARLYDDDLIYNSYKNKIKFKGKSGSIFLQMDMVYIKEKHLQRTRGCYKCTFGRNWLSDKDICTIPQIKN